MSLTAKQAKAIDVLLVAPSQAAAGRRLRVNVATLRRWLKEPEFKRELAAAQRQAIAQNIRGITSLASDAIKTIRAVMRNAADDELKLQAAQGAIERLFDADLVMRADEGGNQEAIPGTR